MDRREVEGRVAPRALLPVLEVLEQEVHGGPSAGGPDRLARGPSVQRRERLVGPGGASASSASRASTAPLAPGAMSKWSVVGSRGSRDGVLRQLHNQLLVAVVGRGGRAFRAARRRILREAAAPVLAAAPTGARIVAARLGSRAANRSLLPPLPASRRVIQGLGCACGELRDHGRRNAPSFEVALLLLALVPLASPRASPPGTRFPPLLKTTAGCSGSGGRSSRDHTSPSIAGAVDSSVHRRPPPGRPVRRHRGSSRTGRSP